MGLQRWIDFGKCTPRRFTNEGEIKLLNEKCIFIENSTIFLSKLKTQIIFALWCYKNFRYILENTFFVDLPTKEKWNSKKKKTIKKCTIFSFEIKRVLFLPCVYAQIWSFEKYSNENFYKRQIKLSKFWIYFQSYTPRIEKLQMKTKQNFY